MKHVPRLSSNQVAQLGILFIFLALAMPAACRSSRPALDLELSKVRTELLAAQDTSPEKARHALAAARKRLSPEDLAALAADDDPSIALFASWQRAQRFIVDEARRQQALADPGNLHAYLAAADSYKYSEIPNDFRRLDPAGLQHFLDDVHRILKITPPPDFSWRILHTRYAYHITGFPDDDMPEHPKRESDWSWETVLEKTSILDSKGNLVVRMATADFKQLETSWGSTFLKGIETKRDCFIVMPKPSGYTINAVSRDTGAFRWRNIVWGLAIYAGTGGPIREQVELAQNKEAVFVFAVFGRTAYIEAFSKSTGQCLARFNTYLSN